jgi:hypothetical protein
VEDPPDSGRLLLLGGRSLQLPYSKTRAYLFIAGLGTLATVISSVLDHARVNLVNPGYGCRSRSGCSAWR